MKQWLQRLLYGRYGVDQFSIALLILTLILILFNVFFRSFTISILYLLILIYSYYRIFSRNFSKRRKENQYFLKWYVPIQHWFKDKQVRFLNRKTYKYFKCPNCKQQLRVPRGKGNITITCAKCRTKFDARS